MRKLVEVEKDMLIQCDNTNCNFFLPYNKKEDENLVMYINTACPDCGENLLTAEDYLNSERIKNIVNFINKWFSWLTIFSKKAKPEEETRLRVHVHKGIKFNEDSLDNFDNDIKEKNKNITWKDLKLYQKKE